MTRFPALLATLALALGLAVTVTPAATADEAKPQPACKYTVPELPDECLTQPVYDLLTRTQADKQVAMSLLSQANDWGNALSDENGALRQDVRIAREQRDAALFTKAYVEQQRDAAVTLANSRLWRILVLRAKVKELRDVIRG